MALIVRSFVGVDRTYFESPRLRNTATSCKIEIDSYLLCSMSCMDAHIPTNLPRGVEACIFHSGTERAHMGYLFRLSTLEGRVEPYQGFGAQRSSRIGRNNVT